MPARRSPAEESRESGGPVDPIVAKVETAVESFGLSLRGGFIFEDDEAVPAAQSGRPARCVLLIGNVGAAFWTHFDPWRRASGSDLLNPLDAWSREVMDAVANRVGARAVSPSDRPYLPFQQWAMRAQGLRPSPLGILMDPEFGLWHAYRGALLFDRELALPDISSSIHLCDQCHDKPCKRQCPVGAHRHDAFAYENCLAHLGWAAGSGCLYDGCFDRNACPYGTSYRYPRSLRAFLMSAFAS